VLIGRTEDLGRFSGKPSRGSFFVVRDTGRRKILAAKGETSHMGKLLSGKDFLPKWGGRKEWGKTTRVDQLSWKREYMLPS